MTEAANDKEIIKLNVLIMNLFTTIKKQFKIHVTKVLLPLRMDQNTEHCLLCEHRSVDEPLDKK